MYKKNNESFSYQSALFGYLTPKQQMAVRPVLRIFKKWAQDELCCALMDYIEKGEETAFDNVMLDCAFCYLTCECLKQNDSKAIINPKSISQL